MGKAGEAFEKLLSIMDELREKCPWDRKQTLESLRQLTLEEVYELTEAIDLRDWQALREETGDVLLHLVFYARIANEQQQFDITEVIEKLCQKLIERHPHIYGERTVADAEEVKRNWEQIKLQEGKSSVLSGVPSYLPALVKAIRLQEKAAQVGFEWENTDQVWEKVQEEMAELQEAIARQHQQQIEEELGDLLFALVNYARFLRVDAEKALEAANRKFKNRFQMMEQHIKQTGKDITQLNLQEMDAIWDKVKSASRA
ncbi:nucleoside triphosphate pyrophosphohydrolase [Thermoflavifilum thermophilum]|uniref:Nucleoside triphosphate pyrophosphohydrolase n=1 Tax=Thermoflavifilum thermophilum TaxID=1393122 RepID=A0A1I7NLP3_9BACT|nr:nucleoside triphosphate pyrophosphohydrolase [Thermoflavifilum thermophilum]SFV35557.1 XTP/dITP diphosphohydrolase [Thermoflavifilum thermophilum]